VSADHATPERAVTIFDIEERRPGSAIADKVWRARSEPVATFTSVASTHWEMVVTRHKGRTALIVRGPEVRATVMPVPQDTEFFGIEFRIGTRLADLPFSRIGGAVTLPQAGTRSFWLNGSAWELPTFANADIFLERLFRRGRVVRDPAVEKVLREGATALSSRSARRHVRHATGLTLGLIRQIDRAHQAVALLERGVPLLDVVDRAGYADQPHLTRSLKRFVGHTPGRIVRDHAAPRSTS